MLSGLILFRQELERGLPVQSLNLNRQNFFTKKDEMRYCQISYLLSYAFRRKHTLKKLHSNEYIIFATIPINTLAFGFQPSKRRMFENISCHLRSDLLLEILATATMINQDIMVDLHASDLNVCHLLLESFALASHPFLVIRLNDLIKLIPQLEVPEFPGDPSRVFIVLNGNHRLWIMKRGMWDSSENVCSHLLRSNFSLSNLDPLLGD
jgi:hypothetical protein